MWALPVPVRWVPPPSRALNFPTCGQSHSVKAEWDKHVPAIRALAGGRTGNPLPPGASFAASARAGWSGEGALSVQGSWIVVSGKSMRVAQT